MRGVHNRQLFKSDSKGHWFNRFDAFIDNLCFDSNFVTNVQYFSSLIGSVVGQSIYLMAVKAVLSVTVLKTQSSVIIGLCLIKYID